MNIVKVLLTPVAVVMVAAVATPVAVAPAVAMTIRQILALIPVMNMPVGTKVHASVHGHTVIRVILAITAVAAVAHLVQPSVRQIYHNHVHAIQPVRN